MKPTSSSAPEESPVKTLRLSLELTQVRLARLANVSQTHISEVESGDADLSERLAAFFSGIGQSAATIRRGHKAFMRETAQKARASLPAK